MLTYKEKDHCTPTTGMDCAPNQLSLAGQPDPQGKATSMDYISQPSFLPLSIPDGSAPVHTHGNQT